jgi:hypothetical protein
MPRPLPLDRMVYIDPCIWAGVALAPPRNGGHGARKTALAYEAAETGESSRDEPGEAREIRTVSGPSTSCRHVTLNRRLGQAVFSEGG